MEINTETYTTDIRVPIGSEHAKAVAGGWGPLVDRPGWLADQRLAPLGPVFVMESPLVILIRFPMGFGLNPSHRQAFL